MKGGGRVRKTTCVQLRPG